MLKNSVVRTEIQNWVDNYLDKPSEFYNGLKPCPFAKSAMDAGEVHVLVGNLAVLRDLIATWSDDYRLIVLCVPEEETEGVEDYCETQNEFFAECQSDLILIPFLPGDEEPDDPELNPETWGAVTEEAYAMVFLQRLEEINRMSYVLEERGYYERVSPEFWAYIQKRRALTQRSST